MNGRKGKVISFQFLYRLEIVLGYSAVLFTGLGHLDLDSGIAHRPPHQVAHIVGIHSFAQNLDHILSSAVSICHPGGVYFPQLRRAPNQIDAAFEV